MRDQIEKLLQAGQPKKALDVLARSKVQSPWSTNAIAVCLLRLGQAEQAVELFRNLVLSGSLFLRPDVPTTWKVNFATALLMADNLVECVRLLGASRTNNIPACSAFAVPSRAGTVDCPCGKRSSGCSVGSRPAVWSWIFLPENCERASARCSLFVVRRRFLDQVSTC